MPQKQTQVPETVDELETGMHVMYQKDSPLTHGARVEKVPPWTDGWGTEHDDDGLILLRRPDDRVVRATIDAIVEITGLDDN